MSKFEDKKEAAKWVIAVVIIVAINIAINGLMSYLYTESSLLIFHFFSVWYNDSLGVVIFFLMVAIFYICDSKRKGEDCNVKKAMLIFSVFSLVYMGFVNIFEVSKRYEGILIDGDKPSRFEYKYNIILDAIEGNTETKDISVENVETYINHYVARSGKSSRSSKSYYVRFKIGDRLYSSLENSALSRCIDTIINSKSTITIEYYTHTGIIKSIDGIDKNNIDSLTHYAVDTRNSAIVENQNQEQESIKQEEDKRINSAVEFSILSNSLGKTITEVEAEFKKMNILPTYKTVYISTKMYNVNEIAFYYEDILYVVEDNSKEDLVAFPVINEGMTKTQIINILTEAGFSYECEEFECDMHGTKRLHTKGHSTGTYVPKQHTVWFSVDK